MTAVTCSSPVVYAVMQSIYEIDRQLSSGSLVTSSGSFVRINGTASGTSSCAEAAAIGELMMIETAGLAADRFGVT